MTILKRCRVVAKDERGGEVLEYAVIAGLIVVTAITIISAIGPKVVARWTTLDSALGPSNNKAVPISPSRVSPVAP